jgi:hypothetical protein
MSRSAQSVVSEFGAREGTYRANLIATLASNMGKQLTMDKVMKGTYGAAKEEYKGALGLVCRGASLMIQKGRLPYKIVRERGSIGLYKGGSARKRSR